MRSVLRLLFWLVSRILLAARYRIRVHGLDKLRDLKGGTLILPNHPGYIDPPLVLTSLWHTLHPRPLLFEGNFHNPVLRPLMNLLRAVKVPDLERPSAKGRARTRVAIQEVIDGLARGENHIMWPSGYLWRDGVERLGGAQAVAEILKAVPGANVVLVRTRGVWGSQFSFAQTGQRPNFLACLRSGFGYILANLLFFMPRRSIDITVERIDRNRLPALDRAELNPFFEQWYNAEGPETPTWVPYHFLFGRRTYEFPPPGGPAAAELGRVTDETKREVARIIERQLKKPLPAADQHAGLPLHQLGLDSLQRMELTLEVEQRFGFSSEQSPATLGQLWLLGQGLLAAGPEKAAPAAWNRPSSDTAPPRIEGDTVAAAFVAQALAHPRDVAAADDQSGVLTYGRFLAAALVLARRFAPLPQTNVGLLMPASVGCDLAFLALQLAGKVPVVLNFTTGPHNLTHAVRATGLRRCVTSNQFIDRLEEKVVQAVKDAGADYLCLDDILKELSKWELLRALLKVRLSPGSVRAAVPQVGGDEPAVILFTSGSEKAPKAVPLSHTNLLRNQQDALSVLGLSRRDAMLGFLPPFHSFGLSVTSLLPLLSGVRVVHHPDPTAAAALVRKITAYRPTLLGGVPTFVRYILDRARPGQLKSLRIVCVGGEKCPETLRSKCTAELPETHILEGYGITECSPVVAVNLPTANRPGTVGKPLPSVEVCIVEHENVASGAALGRGQTGMLLVSGPTIFPGYIATEESPEDPFLERDGKRWYRTGDLAQLDAEGFLKLEGRLKRFLKIGGEMVSLDALEQPFSARYPPTEDGLQVAVEGTDVDRRLIVLFCAKPLRLDLELANELLRGAGLSGVNRFDEVRQIDKIPVLGTGKPDVKVLRKLL